MPVAKFRFCYLMELLYRPLGSISSSTAILPENLSRYSDGGAMVTSWLSTEVHVCVVRVSCIISCLLDMRPDP
jgi:hypothetical protein